MLSKRFLKSAAVVGFAVVGLAVAGTAIGAMAIGALAIGLWGLAGLGWEWPDRGVEHWEVYCG
jgi:hypothetical protein